MFLLIAFSGLVGFKIVFFLIAVSFLFSFPWSGAIFLLSNLRSGSEVAFYAVAATLIIIGCHINGCLVREFFRSEIDRKESGGAN